MASNDLGLRALAGPSKTNRLAALDKLEGLVTPDVLATLRDIENVKLDLVDSRNKERHLENLLRLITVQQPEDTEIAAFHHLLGSLYINFEKFWGPTVRILIDFLKLTRIRNCLLGHLLDQLVIANGYIYNDEDDTTTQDVSRDRPDHVLHRNFILQLLAKFPEYVEANSVLFMDQLFLFAREELFMSPFIEKIARHDLTLSSDPRQKGRVQVQKSKETMITMFRIVQSFQNMSVIHRQQEFKDLILDLLICRDASVQKAAFNCLAGYNTGFIAPYMDKILKLLDERKARSELSNFAIGGDSNTIREDHRAQLVPIIQRILFGRMISRVDKKSAGREKADTRKSIVMRYISGCTVDEIFNFFRILFDPIYKHIECPYEKLEQTLREDMNIKAYIPLNKLQAMLATVSSYLQTVAHQKEETLPHLLKLINIITYYVVVPLEEEEIFAQIEPNCLATLKILRRSCVNIVTDFFQSSQYYKYSTAEEDFVFKYIVWPSSTNFIDRNHATVTPILRLINSFVQNDVYHHLLVKRDNQNENVYLLQLIMTLYDDPKIERPVSIYISRMIAKLLNIKSEVEAEEDENDEDGGPMICQNIPDIDHLLPKIDDDQYALTDEASIGLRMILRYTPIIFERLRTTCELALLKKVTNFRLEDCELQVLSVLGGYIKDSSQCMLAANLLLSTLDSQKNSDVILSTMKTVQALMKHVNEKIDVKIIDHIAAVLAYQRNIDQRRELSNLISVIAQIDTQLHSTSVAIRLLNSTNENFVEAPDLEKWGEGFRIAFEYLDGLGESAMNDPSKVRDSLVLLIHQIGYIINTVDKYEFSVRENCAIFYEKLAQKINHIDMETNGDLVTMLVRETILDKFIKKGFRETNETIKHTYIGIARTLAMICHEKNPVLSELYLFCDINHDLDFWLNIRHIQLHNRSKALARLVASSKLQEVSSKTLSSFFMPLADGFLFNKAYKSLISLSDNAIKLIGLICRNLNWVTYESTLSYYLGQLTKANTVYQRTNIKLITEIIKNFNFDMAACAEAMQNEEENRKLEKRMRRRCGEHKDDARELVDAPKARRLNPSTARMVYYAVTKKLIPRLSSCLHEMTRVDFESDKNMSDYLPEKDEIKRIPMAYAIVQLLNLLPGKYVLLRDNLPALLLKLVTFLKSKNEQTRKAARATLMRIMLFVGPTYVPDMLRILKQNMDRGFHIHVLNYTVHAVLSKVDLGYGDLDSSSYEIVDLCKREIFGQPSEDKEVAKVVAKTAEARKTTGYDTLEILATHISVDKLNNLVGPIKALLKISSDSKTVNKLAVCIQRIWTGLAQNNQFPLDELLSFIRASIEESLPNLRVRHQVEAAEEFKDQTASGPLREDRFLIAKDKSKLRVQSRINEKGNLHMVVENSLRLLLSTFEKNKSHIKQDEILQQKLDDFISLLTTCLKSSSPRCVTRSLKCMSFIAQTRIDLPSFKTKANSIVRKIFILLSLYNGVGMVQGDNYEMIAMCFKTLTLLLLKCEHVQLEEKQIRALMSYIEQDLNDAMRQATAFNALNSILQKKCESPELADVMNKVADLLVTSDDDGVRLLSIKIWQTYLLEYKHDAAKLQAHLAKFLRQIDYEYIDGRKSVLGMLLVIVEKFPEPILRGQFELFFHLLAQRVVNDDSKEIRASVGRLIVRLLQRLPETQDIVLVKFVLPWSSSSNLELKMLGIKLLSIMIEANRGPFEKNAERIGSILTILNGALERRVDAATEDGDEAAMEDEVDEEAMEIDENSAPGAQMKQARRVTVADKLVYHALRLFKRLLTTELIACTETRHIEQLKKIWQNLATDKLSHSHEPVIATTCELYLIFISKTELRQALAESDGARDQYVNRNAIRIVRLLCDRFVELLDKFEPKNTICKYAMQGLIVLGQMVANSEATLAFEQKYAESFDGCDILNYMLNMEELPNNGFVSDRLPYQLAEAKKRVDLMWLSVKVVMQARKEAAMYRLSQSYRREFVLGWLAAIGQELGARRIVSYVFLFLMTPVRELTDKVKMKSDDRRSAKSDGTAPQQSLVPLAQDLLKFIKGLVGVESFNRIYPKVQLHYTKRRINRKKNVAISRVRDQAHGVRRRLEEGRKKRDNNKKRLKRKRTA